MFDHVIYHDNCNDGTCAALLVLVTQPDAPPVLHPIRYGDPAPNVNGVTLIADFSFDPSTTREIARNCDELVLLDHHKTARDMFNGEMFPPNTTCVFDMERSGARMVYDYLCAVNVENKVLMSRYEMLVANVEDVDLWRHLLSSSKDLSVWLESFGASPETWLKILCGTTLDDAIPWVDVRAEAKGMLRQTDRIVTRAVADATAMTIGGYPALAAPFVPGLHSQIAGQLAKQAEGIGVTYRIAGTHAVISLRSLPEGPDVSQIASLYNGGGGHRNAAGCEIPVQEFMQMFLPSPADV